jgi:DnaJ-domain-containing protein 1
MGIFDRFSRLVRSEFSHQLGGRRRVDPGIGTAREPPARPAPSPEAGLSDKVLGAFRVLGLRPGVDRATARAAYVAALKDHHPDRHQDDGSREAEATEASARINEAWDRLKRHYDG